MSVLRFADEACREVSAAGGKGASLARMAALGLPVPPGFVVHADALAQSLGPRTGELLEALAADKTEAQRIVEESDIAGDLSKSIEAAYGELGDDPTVAVRSISHRL